MLLVRLEFPSIHRISALKPSSRVSHLFFFSLFFDLFVTFFSSMGDHCNATAPNSKYKTATSGNPLLETSKSDRHVWLMKCPTVVSRSLCQRQSPHEDSSSHLYSGGPVAKVVVAVDPLLPNDDFSSTQFTMELAATESGSVPKCYSMDMSTDFVPMYVFSESPQGRISAEGKIYHKFDMKLQTENIAEYGKLCRERTKKYMTKPRRVQVIDHDNGRRIMPMHGMIGFNAPGLGEKKKLPAKGSDSKRTRRDPQVMEQILFRLFERQPNWALKQLIQETDQPEQFVKDMLKGLCVYNNKGANQGTYELKPEYRLSEFEPNP